MAVQYLHQPVFDHPDSNGKYVLYSEAQAEIDRLKAENAELLVALEDLLGEHEALTASAFVVHEKARVLIDKERGES